MLFNSSNKLNYIINKDTMVCTLNPQEAEVGGFR